MPVYMIRAGNTDMVKIGWSDQDIETRVRVLQTAHYEDLTVIRVIPVEPWGEKALHRRFRDRRVRREWFRFHMDMLTDDPDQSFLAAAPIRKGKPLSTDLVEASRKAGVRGVYIAGSLGVGQATVNRWLHRETPVPPKHIRRFAELLKITPEEVLPPESTPTESEAHE